jgi:uncharacterized membrane protein
VNPSYIFALALGIGVVAGLRSMTAPAVVAWAAHLGSLHLHDTSLAFMGSTIAVGILSVFAIGELIADKLPKTPRRTMIAPLLARAVTGGLCGACLDLSRNQSLIIGAILGAVGAVLGAFGGYEIRKRLVSRLNIPDLFVALPEDLIAIASALFFVSR